MMHLRLPIPARLRARLPLGRSLGLAGGRWLPLGLGLAGLVVVAGVKIVVLPAEAPPVAPVAVVRVVDAGAAGSVDGAGRGEAAVALPAPSARQQLPGPVPAVIMRVPDGDTLGVTARIWLGQEVQVLVRLRGIDAPEQKGACAAEKAAAGRAQDRLTELSGGPGATVTLTAIAPDKYNGRVIADVSAGGTDLAAALLGDGLVRRYDGGRRQPWCGS
ncbi:thermonuclease family protein [Segnochrobactraceae bacterium EtOH-i3]